MAKLSSSSWLPFLRKTLCALLLVSVSLSAISDDRILANAQTADAENLRSRVIGVTKGLNEDALRGFFDDANFTSYQSKAFLQLSRQVDVDGFTDEKIAQYYALYCIYYATNAVGNDITDNDPRFENIIMPEWIVATNWKDVTNVDPCGVVTIAPTNAAAETSIATTLSVSNTGGWHGITCDADGRVIYLELYNNFLTGTWPEEIVLLASDGPFSTGAGNLEKLDLYKNEFLSNGGVNSWMSDLGSNMSEFTITLFDMFTLPERCRTMKKFGFNVFG